VKLQCDLCKEIVPAEFTVAGNAIDVACPACKGTFKVDGRADAPIVELARVRAARRAPAAGEASMVCPKCDDEQPPGAACRSCGLLSERMAEFKRERDAKVPPELVEAWDTVHARWSDDAAHEQFVRVASTAMSYPWAAQRYREALRLRPDDPLAASQLARLAKMAEATLLATAVRRPDAGAKPYKKLTAMLIAVVAFALLGIVYAVVVSRSTGDAVEPVRKARPKQGGAPTPKPRPPKSSQPGAPVGP